MQTIPAWDEDDFGTGQLGKVGGSSLHGGGLPLENSVPARPDRDGTTHVVFERGGFSPLYFMAKLAALVPKPRTNLTGPPTDDFME